MQVKNKLDINNFLWQDVIEMGSLRIRKNPQAPIGLLDFLVGKGAGGCLQTRCSQITYEICEMMEIVHVLKKLALNYRQNNTTWYILPSVIAVVKQRGRGVNTVLSIATH